MSRNTSFSARHTDLPGGGRAFDQAAPARSSFTRAHDGANDAASGSQMVQRDRPHPAPRPGWAEEIDRQHFNQSWEREQRRAAFFAARGFGAQARKTGRQQSCHPAQNRGQDR